MKTSELSGALLDCWVAKAEGWKNENGVWSNAYLSMNFVPPYSHNWCQAGPIIERERIAIEPFKDTTTWSAFKFDTGDCALCGATPLEASMRCYVASKFGDEVPDEISK